MLNQGPLPDLCCSPGVQRVYDQFLEAFDCSHLVDRIYQVVGNNLELSLLRMIPRRNAVASPTMDLAVEGKFSMQGDLEDGIAKLAVIVPTFVERLLIML